MNMNEMLEQVTRRNDTWQGRHRHFQDHRVSANNACHGSRGLATGYATLGRILSSGRDVRLKTILEDSFRTIEATM